MKRGAIVIFESTVYPGAAEEVRIPMLEQSSSMKWQRGFTVGYSPERINPGDKARTLVNTIKVVSCDNPETLDKVAKLYKSVVKPGVNHYYLTYEAEMLGCHLGRDSGRTAH